MANSFWERKDEYRDAYINKNTEMLMNGEIPPKAGDRFKSDYAEMLATNPNLANDIKEQANAALTTALDLMAKLKENDLLITRKEVDASNNIVEKLNRASVKVDIYTAKDDGHKYLATSINIAGAGNPHDTFVARVENGDITGVSIKKAYSQSNPLEPIRGYKNIAEAKDVAPNLKAITKFVADNGMIHYKKDEELEDANRLFANRPKTEFKDTDGTIKTRPDTYVRRNPSNNSLVVRSQQQLPDIDIEFGTAEDGSAYVKATNWAMTRDGKPRDNNAKDVS